jgi:hypothetical protein
MLFLTQSRSDPRAIGFLIAMASTPKWVEYDRFVVVVVVIEVVVAFRSISV